jgi:transcription-repair coupling factor (superfamily II helicase)
MRQGVAVWRAQPWRGGGGVTIGGPLDTVTATLNLDPLSALPDDRDLVRARDVAARIGAAGSPSILHVAGAAGAMPALVARAIALADKGPIVCVTSDADAARAFVDDLNFVWGNQANTETAQGQVLFFAPPEASPYADVNPDRRAAMGRLVTLFHLAVRLPWRFLVVPAAALARKVVPRAEVEQRSDLLLAEQEVDRDQLARRLSEAGYLRVPLVEDPGSFAVRGAVVDLWPASSEYPVRLELFGDLVLSLKPFDPMLQRTTGEEPAQEEGAPAPKLFKKRELKELWLPPARETILEPGPVERARELVRSLCDHVNLPSSRARALVEDVASGRTFFGAEGFLPAFYELETLFDYLPADTVFLLDDPPAITKALREEIERARTDEARKEHEPRFPLAELYQTEEEAAAAVGERRVVALHRAPVAGGSDAADLTRFEATPIEVPSLAARDQGDLERGVSAARASRGKHGALDPLFDRLAAWREAGLSVILAARTENQAERLTSLIRHRDLPCSIYPGRFDPALLDAHRPETAVVTGPLARGVVAPAEGLVLVTEEEVFGRRAHRARARSSSKAGKPFLEDLRALSVGDHVVHVEHGIGKYLGLIHKDIGGLTVDLLLVEYGGGDKLYLPAYRLNQVQKWSGGEGSPRLDRLGGQTFSKTKQRVEKQVRKMADELLRLYAERQSIAGDALPSQDDDYRAFEATFPFDETPDQARAIDDVFKDLETPKPMDRLVCGDVGFGKTEVAIRAAFRTAQSGKQVAVLCPTTVLAQQHYLSFEARMRDYPIKVGVLSRFQNAKEQADVVRGLKDGTIDVVVGTHRMLSKDVYFKRLGLLVIDEEQRFGVTHKERIKQLKQSVHVLTLSATPIPRTLQMAVSGLRDMSLIATPPVDRRAIRTIVTRADDVVVREAIRRELSRGGQVFYVYNRIDGIYERAARVQALVPEARVAVGHGQMAEGALEQSMFDFVEGRYDILVSTAIIESGLDIPRANTIVIDRADMFGLAQLYQLRGRVGRAKDRGYCYLIVPPPSSMTDEARARIEALERHTDLGSGFQIASLDLELRGAGDLLGGEQSGNVASVGFDIFCQMLEEAVDELRGEPVIHEVDPELSFDAEALLPEEYISDVGVRLSLYKRLASADNEQEVVDLAAEMEDRFGPPPTEAKRLVHLMRIKTELRTLRALGCEASARSVTLHLREDTPVDPAKLTALVTKKGSPYRVTPDMRVTRKMTEHDRVEDGLGATDKMLAELALCLKE